MKEWGPGWFDQLYLEQYELLKNCAFRSLGDEMLCDEIVQEAFLVLLIKEKELKKKRHPNLAGWLMLTVRNLVKNEIARTTRRNECYLNDEEVIVTEDRHRLLEAILPATLSDEERQILVWLYEDCHGTQEISQLLRVPENTARVKIHRAREKYKKISENEEMLKQNGLLITYSSEGV
ncbi:MAG: sigma-70 family RNA polymerase sigma factor [Ruminococcaceae bacterium]|nr:sigma-70 family RNA polymerase sigma factor [Oscillospiraceae bacterium]